MRFLTFSARSTWIFQTPLLLSMLISALIFNKPQIFFVLLLAGILGMVAESFYSYYWSLFFKKPNWIYTLAGLFHNYTSWLNIIPWATGTILYVSVLVIFFPFLEINNYLWFAFKTLSFTLLSHLLCMLWISIKIRILKKKHHKFAFSFIQYIIISMPILIWLFIIPLTTNSPYLYYSLSLLFGAITFFVEYLYGKFAKKALGKKLWIYNNAPIDNKHTSYTNILAGIIGAYLFTFIFFALVK